MTNKYILFIYLFFLTFTALLQQYTWTTNPNNPNQHRIRPTPNVQPAINQFLADISQPGGPIEEAYNYLRSKGLLPAVAVS